MFGGFLWRSREVAFHVRVVGAQSVNLTRFSDPVSRYLESFWATKPHILSIRRIKFPCPETTPHPIISRHPPTNLFNPKLRLRIFPRFFYPLHTGIHTLHYKNKII